MKTLFTLKTVTFLILIILACSHSNNVRKDLAGDRIKREHLRQDRASLPVQESRNVIRGSASYYGKDFHGKPTASGEIYDMFGLSAAHKTLPLGTVCRVTNLKNGRVVTLKINDRGPFVGNRILDLSYGAAERLDAITDGVIDVEIEILELPEN